MIFTVTLNPVIDRTLVVSEIHFNDVLRSQPARLDWGGKGFNVSRALKVLGMESVALGFVGGMTGKQIQAGLNALDIPTDFTWISGETRTNVVVLEEQTGRHIKVNEPGPSILPGEIKSFFEKVDKHLFKGDTWVLSGSLPPGVEVAIYAQLIQKIQSAGARAILDTSGEALQKGIEAGPFLIKPNRQEAEQVCAFTLKIREDYYKAAKFFREKGVALVAISLGSEGLYFDWGKGSEWVIPPAIQAGNPTGAGDALLAGLIWSLERGDTCAEAARWAVACGSTAVQGAGVGLPSKEAVEKLFNMLIH